MKTDSPFLELEKTPRVKVWFDGEPIYLPKGVNLAAALLSAGIQNFRFTPVSGKGRAPYCMMGACYDCLVEIDGTTKQSCMMVVKENLEIHRVKNNKAKHDKD